mgnify:CR=1 FL=1
MNVAQLEHRRVELGPGRELLVVDRQDERRGARLLLGELRQVAVARHAEDLHPLLLDRRGERADAEARRVLRAEVFVDDDDGKAEFHAPLLGPVGGRQGKGVSPWPRPCQAPHCAPALARDASDSGRRLRQRRPDVAPRATASRAGRQPGSAACDGGDRARPGDQAQPSGVRGTPAPGQVLLGGHHAPRARASSPALPMPTTNMTSISAQRQPTQNTPWSTPMRNASRRGAPTVPARVDEAERRAARARGSGT